MSFSPDWFFSLQGILITVGVILLIVALILLLTNKKEKEEPEVVTPNNDYEFKPINNNPEVVTTPQMQQPVVENQVQEPIKEVEQLPIAEPTLVLEEQSVIPEPISNEQPKIEIFEPNVASVETPSVEDVKPAVSIYGGVSPTSTINGSNNFGARATIYGGANPLENTAPIPVVEDRFEPYRAQTPIIEQPEEVTPSNDYEFKPINNNPEINNTPPVIQPVEHTIVEQPKTEEVETLEI